MNKKTVTIQFEDLKTTGRKAAQITIKDLQDAIAANQDNYEFLQEMKREFTFAIMGLDKKMAELKYPNLTKPFDKEERAL